jgi:hypothetical protein
MVNDTDIVELELKSKRFSLSLKKKAALQEQVVQVRYFVGCSNACNVPSCNKHSSTDVQKHSTRIVAAGSGTCQFCQVLTNPDQGKL